MLLMGTEGVNFRGCQQVSYFLVFFCLYFDIKRERYCLEIGCRSEFSCLRPLLLLRTKLWPRAAGINHLDTNLPNRKQQASVTRDGVKSCVNVYPGRLLASWSLTGGFAACLLQPLQLVLPLASVGPGSLASALVWGFWDWRSY